MAYRHTDVPFSAYPYLWVSSDILLTPGTWKSKSGEEQIRIWETRLIYQTRFFLISWYRKPDQIRSSLQRLNLVTTMRVQHTIDISNNLIHFNIHPLPLSIEISCYPYFYFESLSFRVHSLSLSQIIAWFTQDSQMVNLLDSPFGSPGRDTTQADKDQIPPSH